MNIHGCSLSPVKLYVCKSPHWFLWGWHIVRDLSFSKMIFLLIYEIFSNCNRFREFMYSYLLFATNSIIGLYKRKSKNFIKGKINNKGLSDYNALVGMFTLILLLLIITKTCKVRQLKIILYFHKETWQR